MNRFGQALKAILIGLVALYSLIFSGIRACYRRWPKPTVITGVVLVVGIVVAGVFGGTAQNATTSSTSAGGASAASSASPAEDAAAADPESDSAEDEATTEELSGVGATVSSGAVSGTETGVTALAVLDTLEIKGRAAKTGYARDQFSDGWKDPDRNGCDARNDMLARDLTDVVTSGGCKVLSGRLADVYTSTTIDFVRGNTTSSAVQIDHVVALSNAWQTGAQQLSSDQRELLANDPLNLQSVDGPTNQAKGAGDAATWLPPNKGYRCEYVARQVSVKAAYDLWVTQAEHDAITRVLETCPDQQSYQSTLSPYTAVASVATQAQASEDAGSSQADSSGTSTSGSSSTGSGSAGSSSTDSGTASSGRSTASNSSGGSSDSGGSVYYANCKAVRAAGKAPLYAGQPGYATPRLDRDGDGVACE